MKAGPGQVVMPLIIWAIHMIQWFLQKGALIYIMADLKNNLSSDYMSATWLYEDGIASNRLLV